MRDVGQAEPDATPKKSSGRRKTGAIDPYREIALGEEHLREMLRSLTVEQLKDIVSEQALDSSRLALKWRSRQRLEDLIVETVRSRIEKGDGFRT